MAKLTVNIGSSANDRTGDNLRTAFNKLNSNFDEVYVSVDSLTSRITAVETGSTSNSSQGNTIVGDIQGSVVGEDSTVLVDGVNSNVNAANLTGTLPAIDGSNLTNLTIPAQTFASLTSKPTTLAGYGITDALTAGSDFEGNLSGSVFADDSTLLVDGVNGTLTAGALTGALPALDGSALTDVAAVTSTTTVFTARADVDLLMGEVVYITGISGNTPTIDKAQANAAGTMPAFGIVKADVTANNPVEVITFGSCPGHDAANFAETGITFSLGDTVYVSATEAGKLTNVAPAGESNLIQNIGKIERATPTTNMTIKVGGAGRTNATPALDQGNIFIGDAQNRSSTMSFATAMSTYGGALTGDVTGSVFADDSTLLVDGVNGTLNATTLTGALPAIDGSALTSVTTAFSNITSTPTTLAGYGITDALSSGGNITLGGDLDVGGNSIVSASNGAINIAPDGSGTIDLSGQVKFAEGMIEKFATTNGATGVTALDCSTGNVHYLTAPAGDITANFTNLNLTAEYATNVTVVIDQGGTEREITAVQIGGVAQTIVWQGNSAPTGTANGVDSFSFTILNDGGTYVVLGQMVAFGGV